MPSHLFAVPLPTFAPPPATYVTWTASPAPTTLVNCPQGFAPIYCTMQSGSVLWLARPILPWKFPCRAPLREMGLPSPSPTMWVVPRFTIPSPKTATVPPSPHRRTHRTIFSVLAERRPPSPWMTTAPVFR